MQITRLRVAQRLLKRDLARCGRPEIHAPQHVGDAHRRIVYDHCQVVGKHAVIAPQHDVSDLGGKMLAERLPGQEIGGTYGLIGHLPAQGSGPRRVRLPGPASFG